MGGCEMRNDDYFEFGCECAKLVDVGIKMQHFGMVDLLPAIQATLNDGFKREKTAKCWQCDSELTQEEIIECGDICFECADNTDTEGEFKYPDDPTKF